MARAGSDALGLALRWLIGPDGARNLVRHAIVTGVVSGVSLQARVLACGGVRRVVGAG